MLPVSNLMQSFTSPCISAIAALSLSRRSPSTAVWVLSVDLRPSRQIPAQIETAPFLPKLRSSCEMRLLKYSPDGELAVTENLPDNENLKYAILSHTWGSEEVTFEDFKNGTEKNKAGFEKIRFCAEQAKSVNQMS